MCFLSMQSDDSSATGTGSYEVSGDMEGTYSDLKAAVDAINGKTGGMTFTITVNSDDPNVSAFTLNADKSVKLVSSKDNIFCLTKTTAGRHGTIKGSLTLEKITLDGNGAAGGIAVNASAFLTMNDGSMIQNCYVASDGGGVYNYGTLTMNGGMIIGNTANGVGPFSGGGGVYNESKGALIMNSGMIGGNTAANGGGVYNNNNSTFTMNGGMISGNMATTGAGVYNNNDGGTSTMNGGMINGNMAKEGGGGVFSNIGNKFSMKGGEINGNTAHNGGGIRNNGTFTMTGGTISGNTASNGGGIRNGGIFTMNGGEISYNAAELGGGVYNDNSVATISSGEISYNAAGSANAKGSGGGIYAANFAKLTVASGVVFSGNMAPALRTANIAEGADIDGNGTSDLIDYNGGIGAVVLDAQVCAGQKQPAYNNYDINYPGDAYIVSIGIQASGEGTVTVIDTGYGTVYGKLTKDGYVYVPISVGTVTISADAGSGYEIVQFAIDGVSESISTAVVPVSGNISVAAEFKLTSASEPETEPEAEPAPVPGQTLVHMYLITATADSGSEISPDKKVAVEYGKSKTFTFSAKPKHHIVAVYVDGKAVSEEILASGEYTLYDICCNHSIEVISAVSSGGNVDNSGDSEVSEDSSSACWNGTHTAAFAVLLVLIGAIAVIAVRHH
ncbi:MAG: hypothetical protein FWC29_05045 [Methanomassiliicoccaceae archaeon]|nr:hypothetical protein [Methanomassiliicoccaceae archaeon]